MLILLGVLGAGCSAGSGSPAYEMGDPAGGNPSGQPVSLVGTWDVTATRADGSNPHSSFVLSPDEVSMTDGTYTGKIERIAGRLVASVDSTWEFAAPAITVLEPIEEPSLNLGAFPMNLSGTWLAPGKKPERGCILIADGDVTAACNEVDIKYDVLPPFLGNPNHDNFSGKHLQLRPSIFGDLGGSWELESSMGPGCRVDLDGAEVKGSCGENTFRMQVGDGIISGSTNDGIEFTAIRR